ncbi:YncE family protein [Paracoccus limosus]|nr:YncE family protein [Paracoccus limosus]
MIMKPFRTSLTAVALVLVQPLSLAGGAWAQELMTPAEYAGAALRQDAIHGAYELLDAPELGLVFVASAPSFEPGASGAVYALDRDDLSIKRRIQLPRRAFALAMDHDSGRLYVGNTLDGAVTVIDAQSGVITGQAQLGQKHGEGFEHSRMVAVDPKTHQIYVTSPTEKGALWIMDPQTGALGKRVDNSGLWSAGLAIDSDKGRVYVGGGGIEEIGVFDAASGEQVARFSTGDTTSAGKDDSKHFFVNLALDAKGGRLFAADASSEQVYVFDTASGKVTGKVETGPGTLDVAYNPARDEIYVTTRGVSREDTKGTGKLMVIDGKDLTVRRALSLPVHPNSLEVSQDGKLLFVTVKVPHDEAHPDFYKDQVDSVVRFDLSRLD